MNRYEVDCTKTGRFTVYVNEGALNKLLLVFMHALSSQRTRLYRQTGTWFI
jgi:hypothetical protein